MQSCERILDADGEGVFGNQSVGDVDDGHVSFDGDVFADVGFGVQVPEAPAWCG